MITAKDIKPGDKVKFNCQLSTIKYKGVICPKEIIKKIHCCKLFTVKSVKGDRIITTEYDYPLPLCSVVEVEHAEEEKPKEKETSFTIDDIEVGDKVMLRNDLDDEAAGDSAYSYFKFRCSRWATVESVDRVNNRFLVEQTVMYLKPEWIANIQKADETVEIKCSKQREVVESWGVGSPDPIHKKWVDNNDRPEKIVLGVNGQTIEVDTSPRPIFTMRPIEWNNPKTGMTGRLLPYVEDWKAKRLKEGLYEDDDNTESEYTIQIPTARYRTWRNYARFNPPQSWIDRCKKAGDDVIWVTGNEKRDITIPTKKIKLIKKL